MKTKKLFQLALVAGMMSVATMANAQTFAEGTKATNDVDSSHVDYVTVGATMPYESSQANVAAWIEDVEAAGIPTDDIKVTTSIEWFGGNTGADVIPAAKDKPAIQLTWETEGAYTVKAKNSVLINGVASCDPAVSTKKVYVLPKPEAAITTTNKVLPCSTTEYDVLYKVSGIGQKQIAYTVTKKPYKAAEVVEASVTPVTVGSGVAATGFAEGAANYSTALGNYSLGSDQTFKVEGLEAGYIYTLTFNSVSDQISRKSQIDSELTDVKVVLAVVPEPTSTKINHVKNIE